MSNSTPFLKPASKLIGVVASALLISLLANASPAHIEGAETASLPDKPANESKQDKAWIGPIVDSEGETQAPISILKIEDNLYMLTVDSILSVNVEALRRSQKVVVQKFTPEKGQVGDTVQQLPITEFNNFVYYPPHKSIVILDKSGDLFEFVPSDKKWHIFRALNPIGSKPDPDYVDLSYSPNGICLLDPERNQIWVVNQGNQKAHTYFHEVLPWRIQPGDVNVADGIGIVFLGEAYVLKYNGNIIKYKSNGQTFEQKSVFKGQKKMRPSRIAMATGTPIYVVERENNRVLSIDGKGQAHQFVFPGKSNLRGLLPQSYGFWIIDGSNLVYRSLKAGGPVNNRYNRKQIDPRLDGMQLPITGIRLPKHPGVYPGARRLYRFGVHKGVDFFDAGGCSARVALGTKVMAVDSGKLTRADVNFRDMSPAKYNQTERECHAAHQTSEANEDLFRGCQAWVDHGDGLVTRYAHLLKIKDGVKAGNFVDAGTTLGFVGVSGTGESPSGKGIHPHLHFEIWLDDKYLGWGLTPAETRGVYEDIFGIGCQH